MRYIIYDLEATCGEGIGMKNTDNPQEIIEIGAVIFDEEGNELGKFERFVKPVINPQLTYFCKKLTSITQSQVDTADAFAYVIDDFYDEWLKDEDYRLLSWGHYDRKQFVKDCNLHDVDQSWLTGYHASLKHLYSQIIKSDNHYGMKRAMINERIAWTGKHHRGIDDAINTGKIFLSRINEFKPLIEKYKQ